MAETIRRPMMNYGGGGMPRKVVDYSGVAVKMLEVDEDVYMII